MRVSLVSWLPLSACTNRVYDLWSREKLGLLQLARKVCMCTRSSDPSGCLWNLEQLHCMMATSYSAQEVTPACRSCSSSSSQNSPRYSAYSEVYASNGIHPEALAVKRCQPVTLLTLRFSLGQRSLAPLCTERRGEAWEWGYNMLVTESFAFIYIWHK